jgi:hypothetical protein
MTETNFTAKFSEELLLRHLSSDLKLQKIKAKLSDTRGIFAGGELLHVHVIARASKSPQHFTRDENVNRDANHRIDLILNPEIISANARFGWLRPRQLRFDRHNSPTGKRVTKTTLTQCLADFAAEETLDNDNKAFCRYCPDFFRATKKMDLSSVLEILVLHLKRFDSKSAYWRKVDLKCEYPDEIDMLPYVIGPQKQQPLRYRLAGVISHAGGLTGGHYVANASNSVVEEWFHSRDDAMKGVKHTVRCIPLLATSSSIRHCMEVCILDRSFRVLSSNICLFDLRSEILNYQVCLCDLRVEMRSSTVSNFPAKV